MQKRAAELASRDGRVDPDDFFMAEQNARLKECGTLLPLHVRKPKRVVEPSRPTHGRDVVRGRDPLVLELNRKALAELPGKKKLEVIPDATHLFEEPGALESVAELAKSWFAAYLYRANERTRTAS
jgi:hypothetical protein